MISNFHKVYRLIINKLLILFFDKKLPAPTNKEKSLINQLRDQFSQLSDLENCEQPEAELTWIKNMKRLRDLVFHNDPRNFLRWDMIVKSMFVDNEFYIAKELSYLKHLNNWDTRWKEAIEESSVGHPMPYWKLRTSSGNLIHHAYHLATFEQVTGISTPEVDIIFEFGGGYGSMCRLTHKSSFKGRYLIFDLPHFSALQNYYLSSMEIHVDNNFSPHSSKNGVACISDIEKLQEILSDKYPSDLLENSMFIATWSFSEIPLGLRSKFLSFISKFSFFLIAYQDKFEEINNIEFFNSWIKSQDHIKWHKLPIQHLKGSNYLIGQKK